MQFSVGHSNNWDVWKPCTTDVLSKDDIVEYYVFSFSLTGIEKLPFFKR